MDKKLPIPDYIMKIRQKELLYDEAVERILGTNGIVSAPIAVVKIANSFGFGVCTAVLNHGGTDIISVMADSAIPQSIFREQREIIVNAEISPADQQFAVAHEIAHFVMHCSENEDFFEKNVFSSRKSDMEKAADDFALRLVMPTWMLRGFIMGLPPRMRRGEMVHAIAWTFCVSDEMAERRLIEVGYGLE